MTQRSFIHNGEIFNGKCHLVLCTLSQQASLYAKQICQFYVKKLLSTFSISLKIRIQKLVHIYTRGNSRKWIRSIHICEPHSVAILHEVFLKLIHYISMSGEITQRLARSDSFSRMIATLPNHHQQ